MRAHFFQNGRSGFCFLVSLLVGLITYGFTAHQSGRTVGQILVFRTNLEADVHLPTFLPKHDVTKLKFGAGGVIELDQPLGSLELSSIVRRKSDFTSAFFANERTARFCTSHSSLCDSEGKPSSFVLYVDQGGTQKLLTSFAYLSSASTDLRKLHKLLVDPSKPQDLFLVSFRHRFPKMIQMAQRNSPDAAEFDLSSLQVRRVDNIEHRAALSIALALLTYLALVFSGWRNGLYLIVKKSPFSLSLIALWLSCSIFAVFPGIFTVDNMLVGVNTGLFTSWYGTLYFGYSLAVGSLGPSALQIPFVVAGLASVLLVLWMIEHTHGHLSRTSILAKIVLVLGVVLNPAIFAFLFVQQRYFLAVAVLMLGICTIATTYLSHITRPNPSEINGLKCAGKFLAGLIILGIAALLRAEYAAIFLLVFAGVLLIVLTSSQFRLGGALALLSIVAALGGANHFLQTAYPDSFGYDRMKNMTAKYRAISAFHMSKPYVGCDDSSVQDPELVSLISSYSDIDNYCVAEDVAGEWWRSGNSVATKKSTEELNEFWSATLSRIYKSPLPFLKYRIGVWEHIAVQSYEQFIRSHYRQREGSKAIHRIHTYTADRFGMLRDVPAAEPFNRFLTHFYADLSEIGPGFTFLSIGFVFSIGLFFLVTGAPATGLVSLAMISLTIPVALLAPQEIGAYFVFAPAWAGFVAPIGLSERAARVESARRRNLKGFGLLSAVSEKSKRHIFFGVLSGLGWVFDLALYLSVIAIFGLVAGAANFVSASLAAVTVFVIARRWVFKSKSKNTRSVGMYALYTCAMIVFWSILIQIVSTAIGSIWHINELFAAALGKVIVTPLSLIANYMVASRLSIPSNKNEH